MIVFRTQMVYQVRKHDVANQIIVNAFTTIATCTKPACVFDDDEEEDDYIRLKKFNWIPEYSSVVLGRAVVRTLLSVTVSPPHLLHAM